jgi:DNA-binding transcriptional regulator GbsR (MarR family)
MSTAEWIMWSLGGLGGLQVTGFWFLLERLLKFRDSLDEEFHVATKDIWQHLDKLENMRVRKDDIENIKSSLIIIAQEIRENRDNTGKVSQEVGEIKGQLKFIIANYSKNYPPE